MGKQAAQNPGWKKRKLPNKPQKGGKSRRLVPQFEEEPAPSAVRSSPTSSEELVGEEGTLYKEKSTYDKLLMALGSSSKAVAAAYIQRKRQEEGKSDSDTEEEEEQEEQEEDIDDEDDETESSSDLEDTDVGAEGDNESPNKGKLKDPETADEKYEDDEGLSAADDKESSDSDDQEISDSDDEQNLEISAVDDSICLSSFGTHLEHKLTKGEVDNLLKKKWRYLWDAPAGGMSKGKWAGTGECCIKDVNPNHSYDLKQKLYKHWLDVYNTSGGKEFHSSRQKLFFSLFNKYRDILHCNKKPFYDKGSEEDSSIMDAYIMHCLNHVFKTRDVVLKNDAKAAKYQENAKDGIFTDDSHCDCGFTRPKALIVLPMASVALRVVKRIIQLTPASNKVSIDHMDRFSREFGTKEDLDNEDERDLPPGDPNFVNVKPHKSTKPGDFQVLFGGNSKDDFIVGIKFTKRSIRLYSDFYSSDMIVASSVGLLKKISEAKVNKEKDVDYLSSIENWDFLKSVVEQLNHQPSKQHGTDIMRIRPWQTILLSYYPNPDINNLFNKHCTNYQRKVKLVHEYKGVLPKVVLQVRQRFEGDEIVNIDDARFEHFSAKVFPRIKNSVELHPRIFGIYIAPSAEYIVSVLSVLRFGAAFLPLDPTWPKQRLLSVVASADVNLIIASTTPFGCESDSTWLMQASDCRLLRFSVGSETAKNAEGGECDFECECESENERRLFCYVMYTSGSTGKPKGVCGTERGLWNRFRWMQEMYPLKGEEVLLFKTAVSFVDHLQEFLSAVLTGCTLVIPAYDRLKQNPFSIVDFIQAYSINRLTAVPSLMRVILPALRGQDSLQPLSSLNLIVHSGETFPLSLWDMLSKELPTTSILNLYGSTEVSGDCTYFDCKKLPMILEIETLASVPIGKPIAGCDVVIVSDADIIDEGEIFVCGLCNSSGYYSDSTYTPLDTVKLPPNSVCYNSNKGHESRSYFQTGDFAKQLRCGDLVFMGRKDRAIKLNGQRISLEEIERTLVAHPDVTDVAVIFHNGQGELMQLVAFIILKEGKSDEIFRSSIKHWMIDKLPLAMIPGCIVTMKSFPLSTSGKVDYSLLANSVLQQIQVELDQTGRSNLLQEIKKAFNYVLMAEEVSDDDDFFLIGGNSIAAAHLANTIGVDMRLIYRFPTPSKLYMALVERNGPSSTKISMNSESEINQDRGNMYPILYDTRTDVDHLQLKTLSRRKDGKTVMSKRARLNTSVNVTSPSTGAANGYAWRSVKKFMACSLSRCNKVVYAASARVNDFSEEASSVAIPKFAEGHLEELWKVDMGSCVDASPLIVLKDQDIFLFIGSHAQKFVCVSGRSGSVQWESQLEGRVECSAAILGDFSQVVVGCYKGKIYFLDFINGNICWIFQTSGEVKSQPVVDSERQLVWCGSYDHNLYALDYKNHCCVYQLPCGGSICGSPVIDERNNILYVATTGGQVTAISITAFPFSVMWAHKLEAPVFGSLAINSLNGNIICCLVDGYVLALNSSGSITWRFRTAGPVFAGACISSKLPFQVLVCSRDGSIYSLELETGGLLWQYNAKDPITSSAYVDEHLSLVSDQSNSPDSRLVCVSSSSGSIVVIQVNLDATKDASARNFNVHELARLELSGDIFSSPVMIGGRIYVGCRDDYVHCIALKPQVDEKD